MERKITNNTILLFLGETAGALDTVVCLTSVTDNFTVDEVDATTICGPDKMAGELSGSVGFEGQHLLDPTTGKISGHGLWGWMVAKSILFFRIGPAIPAEDDVIKEGVCFITSLSNSYTLNAQSSFSGSLVIKGVPVESIVAGEVIPMTGLWASYDAGAGVTGTSAVTAWADQSGSGRGLVALSGKEPVLSPSAINSLPTIKTGAAVAAMKTVAVFPDTERAVTVFIVGKQIVGAGPLSDAQGRFISTGDNSLYVAREFDGSNDNIYSNFKLNALISPALNNTFYTVRLKWIAGVSELALNNVVKDSMTAAMFDLGSTELFVFSGNGTNFFGNKEIAEILIYIRELTAPEISQVESYLQTKYAHY